MIARYRNFSAPKFCKITVSGKGVPQCWTNLAGRIWILERCWFDIILQRYGIAQGRLLPSVPIHWDKKTAKRKAESGWWAEYKRNQLIKTICNKKGVTSLSWLAAKMTADRSFVGRIVRKAILLGHTRESRCPEFRPELEQMQKRDCEKEGKKQPFEPHRRKDGPSCCPVTLSYRGVLGCPQAGGLDSRTREAGIPKWRGFEKKGLGSVWISEMLGCRLKHDFDGDDQLEDGCGHLAPSTT